MCMVTSWPPPADHLNKVAEWKLAYTSSVHETHEAENFMATEKQQAEPQLACYSVAFCVWKSVFATDIVA